jgi:hypothetical protein
MFPCSSLVWQVPHREITRGSVTGMPGSGSGFAVDWAVIVPASRIANTAARVSERKLWRIRLRSFESKQNSI